MISSFSRNESGCDRVPVRERRRREEERRTCSFTNAVARADRAVPRTLGAVDANAAIAIPRTPESSMLIQSCALNSSSAIVWAKKERRK